jgi:hypothetical protein
MSQTNIHDALRLGFLAAIELPDRGHVGGLLVTNHLGRPLEFQCTAPVKANRTQEILYGPTLAPYLLCELIGRTLLEKIGVKPQLVLTDDPRLLELREHSASPLVLLRPDANQAPAEPAARDAATAPVRLGLKHVVLHPDFAGDAAAIEEGRKRLAGDVDLGEPLHRVREALRETMAAAA